MNKKYYPQERKNKIENMIDDDLDLSSSDSESESDYESCSEE